TVKASTSTNGGSLAVSVVAGTTAPPGVCKGFTPIGAGSYVNLIGSSGDLDAGPDARPAGGEPARAVLRHLPRRGGPDPPERHGRDAVAVEAVQAGRPGRGYRSRRHALLGPASELPPGQVVARQAD